MPAPKRPFRNERVPRTRIADKNALSVSGQGICGFVFDVVIDVVVRLVAFILGVGRRDDVVDKVQGVRQLFAVFLVVPGGVAEVPDAEVIPAVVVPFQLGGAEAL